MTNQIPSLAEIFHKSCPTQAHTDDTSISRMPFLFFFSESIIYFSLPRYILKSISLTLICKQSILYDISFYLAQKLSPVISLPFGLNFHVCCSSSLIGAHFNSLSPYVRAKSPLRITISSPFCSIVNN